IADKYGRKLSMILSFIFYIFSFLIFYFFPIFGFYALAMIFYGFGEAFRSGTHKAMILDYLQQKNWQHKRVDYYGYTRSWSQFGSAISALLAAAIVFVSGSYRYIFLFSILPYLLNLLLMISYPNSLNHPHRSKTKEWKKLFGDFFALFKLAQFRRAILNSTLFDALFKSTKDYLQPIILVLVSANLVFANLSKEQNSALLIGIIYFSLFFLSALAAWKSGWFRARFTSSGRAVDISYIMGISLILLAALALIFQVQIIAVLMLILLYILQNFRRPLNVDLISNLVPHHIMASGLSLESQVKTLLIAIFAPMMGWMADNYGIGAGFLILAFLLLVVSPLVWIRKS
ncbi:MAG: MFS transporter, partial [Candidatus Cloacimonadales bacterium]